MPRFFLSRREALFGALALALVGAISIAAFILLDARVDDILIARQAAIVDSEIRYLKLIEADEGLDTLTRIVARRTQTANDDLPIYALISKDNRYLAGDVDWPDGVIADGRWRPIETYRRKQGERILGYGRALPLRNGAKLLIGRDVTGERGVQAAVVETLMIALGALVVIGVSLVAVLNSRILARIDAIVGTAQRIIAGNLHERIPARGQSGAFDRLRRTLNTMLDRNEMHIDQMRMVTDAIAHDLRLPLQRVKADLERAQTSSDAAERTHAFARADAEMDDALATFNALLEITRAQAGIGAETFDDIDLAEIARDVVELFGPVAEDKGQTLRAEAEPTPMKGQGTLLRQALGNLVQNAIKFSPAGATIAVRVEDAATAVNLIVEDNGPGIPEAQHDEALRPFGRLARDRGTEGKGLGLAMVAACAKLHRGTLRLEAANPGLRAIFELPKPT